jgi:hypothetical protein
MVSALAMTGMRLTLSWSRRMNSMSMSLSLENDSSALQRHIHWVCSRMAGGLDEVEAGVDAGVDDLLAVDTVLLLHVRVVTGLDVVEDGPPTARL